MIIQVFSLISLKASIMSINKDELVETLHIIICTLLVGSHDNKNFPLKELSSLMTMSA